MTALNGVYLQRENSTSEVLLKPGSIGARDLKRRCQDRALEGSKKESWREPWKEPWREPWKEPNRSPGRSQTEPWRSQKGDPGKAMSNRPYRGGSERFDIRRTGRKIRNWNLEVDLAAVSTWLPILGGGSLPHPASQVFKENPK